MANQNQTAIFEATKASLAAELSPEINLWDYPKMLQELREAVDRFGEGPKHGQRQRNFARRYLDLRCERYSQLRGWLAGKTDMTTADITKVLKTLKVMTMPGYTATPAYLTSSNKVVPVGTQVPKPQPRRVRHRIAPKAATSVPAVAAEPERNDDGSHLRRTVVNLTLSTLNVILPVIIESKWRAEDIFDSDRMQITNAMTKICRAFDIPVVFPEHGHSNDTSVTREDMQNIPAMKGTPP